MNRTVFMVAFLAALVMGCERSPLDSANGIRSDLNGTYIFEKNKSGHDMSQKFIRDDIKNGTAVVFKQDGNSLSIQYMLQDGNNHKVDIAVPREDFRWDNGTLVYWRKGKSADAPILPGYARQIRSARLYKTPDGDLAIDSSFTEQGLMLFVVPFKDHTETKFLLKHQP